jgi:hydroxyacylglutathione hydrolase
MRKRPSVEENLPVTLVVDRVVASYFQTNCWIIASERGGECIVVDPGIELPHMVEALRTKLQELNLSLGAIMITHGHLDHTFSLFPLSENFANSISYVHAEDRDLLREPERALSAQSMSMFNEMRTKFPETRIDEPEKTFSLHGGERLHLGGMNVEVLHTPGHTPGSISLTINDELFVSGDTLFAGSIGRTDLPRGSISDMERTLREKIAHLAPHLRVLPGHGNETRIERELKENPYLLQAIQGKLS